MLFVMNIITIYLTVVVVNYNKNGKMDARTQKQVVTWK